MIPVHFYMRIFSLDFSISKWFVVIEMGWEFAILFISWVSPLLKKSRQQGVLHLNDLYDLPPHLKSTELTNELETNWFNEVKRCPTKPSLIRVTLKTLGYKPFLNGLLALLNVRTNLQHPFHSRFFRELHRSFNHYYLSFSWNFLSHVLPCLHGMLGFLR